MINNIKETYCSFDCAKLLKGKGQAIFLGKYLTIQDVIKAKKKS